MKRFAYIILSSLVFLFSACGNKSGHFKLEGKFLNLNQGEFYIYSPDGLISGIDTIKVQGGRFAYEKACGQPGILVMVFPNFSQQPVFAAPGKSVDIKGDASRLKEMQVTGTKDNELMNAFRKQTVSASPPEAKQLARQFIASHPESEASVWLASTWFMQASNPDYAEAASLLAKIVAEQGRNGYAQRLLAKAKAMAKASTGKPLPSFSDTGVKGQRVTAAQLDKAPVAVINVWNSADYNSQDVQRFLNLQAKQSAGRLKVIGISIDADKETALRTLQRDSISFDNICDGRMLEGKTLRKLALDCMPGNLVLRNGRIVARNLRSQELKDRLNELLK